MYYPDPIVHVLFLVGLVLIQNPCILEFPPYTFALCIKIALCRLKDLGGKMVNIKEAEASAETRTCSWFCIAKE